MSTLCQKLIVDTVQVMPDWLYTEHQLGTEQATGSNHTNKDRKKYIKHHIQGQENKHLGESAGNEQVRSNVNLGRVHQYNIR